MTAGHPAAGAVSLESNIQQSMPGSPAGISQSAGWYCSRPLPACLAGRFDGTPSRANPSVGPAVFFERIPNRSPPHDADEQIEVESNALLTR
jgi:hypothetical protein